MSRCNAFILLIRLDCKLAKMRTRATVLASTTDIGYHMIAKVITSLTSTYRKTTLQYPIFTVEIQNFTA